MSRLSREDWAAAALDAIATGGVAAVKVEPIAARLGATKGSFYWHFTGKSALVQSALELWERLSTLEVIEAVERTGGDPRARLRLLFTRVFERDDTTSADVALIADAEGPLVREAIERVTRTRIDYVAKLLRECGLPARPARRRAVFAYSAYLGNIQLMHSTPQIVKTSVGSLSTYADEVIATLVDGARTP